MKCETKATEFQPVVLTLETPNEVALFKAYLGATSPEKASDHFGVPFYSATNGGRCTISEVYETLCKSLKAISYDGPEQTLKIVF